MSMATFISTLQRNLRHHAGALPPESERVVAHYAKTLMNCHDFNTPVKVALLEKIALPSSRPDGDAVV